MKLNGIKHNKSIPRKKNRCKTCGNRHMWFKPVCTKEVDAQTT